MKKKKWKPRPGDVNKITGKPLKVPKGPKKGSLLLPKRYKSEAAALEAIAIVAWATPFSECMVFVPVRCVGTMPDKKPWRLGGRYNWRLRRSFL
jgi:hypothetical protein